MNLQEKSESWWGFEGVKTPHLSLPVTVSQLSASPGLVGRLPVALPPSTSPSWPTHAPPQITLPPVIPLPSPHSLIRPMCQTHVSLPITESHHQEY